MPTQNILIAYATNSGNTLFAANKIARVLEGAGHTITLASVSDLEADAFDAYSHVVMGSCTWDNYTEDGREEGQLPTHMQQFLAKLEGKKYSGKKFAIYGLGDSDFTHYCRAAEKLEEFVAAAEGDKVASTLHVDSFPQKQVEEIEKWATEVGGEFSK